MSFEVKNFSDTYSLLKGNHSMESKIIEYGIIIFPKYKAEQTEVISRLASTFFLTNYKNAWSDRTLHFPNTFSYFFHGCDFMSVEDIYAITF